MKYTIKRNNKDIATVSPTGSLSCKIMAEEIVSMQFVLPKYIVFAIGDTVSVYGTTYVLNQEPTVQKVSTINYAYELQFESFKYDLNKILCLGLNSKNELTEPDYSIMGDPAMLLKHLVANANRLGGNWKVGSADKLEPKNITFSNHNVLSALSMIAEEFETEYWVDGDKTIHLTKKQAISGLSLKYGMSQGLRTISRTTIDSSNVLTRLYAQGSTQNIPVKYRYGSTRLKMDVPFLENNKDKFGLIEFSKTFEDIYPRRNGKVTAVFADDPFRFVDLSQDFDLNGKTSIHGEEQPILLPGISAKVTFNTGQLAGYTFEIKKNGYDHSKKSFVLLKNKDEKAYEVPNNLLRPAVGDQYILTEIVMPEAYITNAEAELKKQAQEYLNENSVPRLQYNVQSDPIYFENQNINLQLGNTIKFVDSDFGLDANIRVVSISKDLQNPYQVEFSIAEQMQQQKIVRDYIEKNKKEQEIRESSKKFNQDIQRNYEFSQEINENVFDAEGYFDPQKIKPLSIETKMFSVGSREQQFTLEDLTFMVEGNNTALRNTKGQIVHYSLEDKSRTWSIPANTLNGISTGFNFIYIKAQKVGNNASVFVSPNQIKVDQDTSFYHFEAGYLSSVSNGFRKIRLSNGFTNINGREITTGRITSQDGKTFIDLDTGEMRGKMTFTDDSPALGQIDDKIGAIEVGGRNLIVRNLEVKNTWIGVSGTIDPSKDHATSDYIEVYPGSRYVFTKETNDKTVDSYFRWAWYDENKTFLGRQPNLEDMFFYTVPQNVKYLRISYPIPSFPKFEKGTIATGWSPAPEDVDKQIQDQEVYSEFSIDGKSNWHFPYQLGDNYQRQRKGMNNWSLPIKITGEDGKSGVNGKDGKYEVRQYSKNTSVIVAPTNGWQSTPMTTTPEEYLWMRTGEVVPPSVVPISWNIPIRQSGPKGIAGNPGIDGKTPIVHTAYANSDDGKINFSLTDSVNRSYWGTYTDYTSQDSSDPTKYTWIKVRGEAITSRVEPISKYVGMVWIDTSKKPSEQKVWDGLKWDFVGLQIENIEVGGRNLIIRSKEKENTWLTGDGEPSPNTENSSSDYIEVEPLGSYIFTKQLVINQDNYFRIQFFDKNKKFIKRETTTNLTYKMIIDKDVAFLRVSYNKLSFPKFEKGTIATGWSPAPEDVDKQIQDQEVYSEFSIDGKSNWHFPYQLGDNYQRQRKGMNNWSLPIKITGEDGKSGVNGKDGKYEVRQYSKNTSVIVAPTNGWQSTPMTTTPEEYLWMRTGEVVPPSVVPISWNIPIRQSGPKGIAGNPGIDGKTPIVHTAYANSDDGKINFSLTDSVNRSYWGTYTDYTSQDSSDPTKYTWIKVRGEAITSRVEPISKYVGMVWIDTSKKPSEQKVWDGLKWDLVGLQIENIEVGGRNLIIRSKEKENTWLTGDGEPSPNTENSSSDYIEVEPLGSYIFTKKIIIGQDNYFRIQFFDKNKKFIKRETTTNLVYKMIIDKDIAFVRVSYNKLSFPKLEKGTIVTGWSPAPEDTQAELDALNLLTSQQRQELETVKRTTDKLNQVTNYLTTTVDGGVVTTSTLQVGATTTNAQGQIVSKAKAGITGVASSNVANINLDRRVVFWASTGFAQRENALFQVWDDGLVVMEKARVKGHIEAESGYFKGRIEANEGKIGHYLLTMEGFSATRTITSTGYQETVSTNLSNDGSLTMYHEATGSGGTTNKYFKFIERTNDIVQPHTPVLALQTVRRQIAQGFPIENVCLRLDANSTGSNVGNIALDIPNGNIRVSGLSGVNGTYAIGNYRLTITMGIITNIRLNN